MVKIYIVVSILLIAGIAQAGTLDWGGSAEIFGPAGDTSWSNTNSWRNQTTAAPGIPVLGDSLIIQRYAWGNEGVPGGGWDTGATGSTLDTTITGLVNVQLATQDAEPIPGGQTAELNLVSGANLTAQNLYMAQVANSTATVNMSGDASMTVGGFFSGASSATINMSGTSTLDITITRVDQEGTWGITMADDAVLTFAGGQPEYANVEITSLDPSKEILATFMGGATWQYTAEEPLPDPFAVVPEVNLISNGQFTQVTNQTGGIPSNLIGSYGDYLAYEGRTLDVSGWQPYHTDPSNLVSMIGVEHLVTGDSGVLNGTFYLDTLFNNNIVLNSSTAYRNGVVQSNMLDGAVINPYLNYNFLVDVAQNTGTDQSQAIFTAALTAGTDITNTANAVAGSLMQVAQTNLPTANGTFQVASVSGADLLAAQSGGPVNVLFNSLNEEVIPGFPTVASNDVNNVDLVSQVVIESVFLIVQNPAGDLNKDGLLNGNDVELAQYYLEGAGGDTAAVRQDAYISAGNSTNEALVYLNLSPFDFNGDDYFDADDVAALVALLPPLELQVAVSGVDMDFEWNTSNGKLYDLESSDSLVITNWAPYNDGVTVYENMVPSGFGMNALPGVKQVGPVRFFRILEKD